MVSGEQVKLILNGYLVTTKTRAKMVFFVMFLTLTIFAFVMAYRDNISSLKAIPHADLPKIESALACPLPVQIDPALDILNSLNTSRQAIFFTETSGRGTLNPRQLCAVESTARHNPDADIYVLLMDPPAEPRLARDEQVHTLLRHHDNVRLLWASSATFFVGTPLQEWSEKNLISTSLYRIEHASDIVRVVTILRYGGIYLDLDFVIQKSLTSMPPNWVTFELDHSPTSSAFSFEKGHPMVKAMAYEQAATFDGKIWAQNGPAMVARVMSRSCGMNLSELYNTGKNCNDVVVLKPDKLYPVPYFSWHEYFQESIADEVMKKVKNSLGVHVFNFLSHSTEIKLGSNQAYSQLAQRHCPRAYWGCFNTF